MGDIRRQTSIEDLQRAIQHQALLSAIVQEMETLQRQVTLLSQISGEQQVTPVSPEDLAQFNFRVESIAVRMRLLQETAEGDADVASFVRLYEKLSSAWRTFYTSFGVDHAKAITALAVDAEPVSQDLAKKLLPRLQNNENLRVQLATARFYSTAQLATFISLGIFLVSIIVAVAVAFSPAAPGSRSQATEARIRLNRARQPRSADRSRYERRASGAGRRDEHHGRESGQSARADHGGA